MSLNKHFQKVIAPHFRARTDIRIGIRCDYGKTFEVKGIQFRWIHVQANKGAEQNILRRVAQKNPHTILGSIKIDFKARMGQEEFLEERAGSDSFCNSLFNRLLGLSGFTFDKLAL
ncbi:hypothetical protein DENSPDRAFT_855438 [Dentipellis sp. KUC8613]|nr:hypothetical protein DENSPDRAFT_855438 [Dentipellis sp. KUC8613]